MILLLAAKVETYLDVDEDIVGSDANYNDGRQHVHEGEEVELEDDGVSEVSDAQRQDDGHQRHKCQEHGARVPPHH